MLNKTRTTSYINVTMCGRKDSDWPIPSGVSMTTTYVLSYLQRKVLTIDEQGAAMEGPWGEVMLQLKFD